MTSEEIKVCGVAACRALFRVRRADIVRVYLDRPTKRRFKALLAYCAEERLAYHIVDADELARVSGSEHHEGIVVLARAWNPSLEALREQVGEGPACVLALDGVRNPHNLGAILRSAANFDVIAALRPYEDGRTPPSTHRVAEGGAEVVPVVRVHDLHDALVTLAQDGFEIVTTAADATTGLFEHRFSERTVLVLGAERDGVSPRIEAVATTALAIPGTGDVESLNVSVATAILLAERWRQTHRSS